MDLPVPHDDEMDGLRRRSGRSLNSKVPTGCRAKTFKEWPEKELPPDGNGQSEGKTQGPAPEESDGAGPPMLE